MFARPAVKTPLMRPSIQKAPGNTAGRTWPAVFGNQATLRRLQAKLAVGPVDDPLEREADRAAEQVMRAGAAPGPRLGAATAQLSRKCAACEEAETLQRAPDAASGPAGGEAPAPVHDVLRATGNQLDPSARAFFEQRFGADFAPVRIHAGAGAAAAVRSVGARAFTVGTNVVVDPHEYAPHSAEGRSLLAHELAHVVQQSGGTRAKGAAGLSGEAASTMRRKPGAGAPTAFNCRTPSDHKHRPAHDWAARQPAWAAQCGKQLDKAVDQIEKRKIPSPDERAVVECICGQSSPSTALEIARRGTMFPGGLASDHIDHYLTGKGVDYQEDLRKVLREDSGVRAKLAKSMKIAPRGCVSLEQSDYSSHDFKYAFGGIDRMDYQVNADGTVRVWFKDRYEWHPEDTSRPSNCVHRAAVELKDSGAADYWMVGDATVPGSWFSSGPSLWERLFD
jgi:hypothetical protein